MKSGLRALAHRMTDEERRERNGDKRRMDGYSSTGVKMATHEQLVRMHDEKVRYQKEHPAPRRSKVKMFISVCMGGHNKVY